MHTISTTDAMPQFVDDSLRPNMPGNAWSVDQVSGGIAIFKGQTKMAVATIEQRYGQTDKGEALMKRLPRPHWRIHLTSPIQSPEDLEAILKALPAE